MTIQSLNVEVCFFTLGSVSILISILVAASIFKMGIRSASTRLVFYLQITQLMEEIWSLPFIYVNPVWLCRFSAGIKEYFTMANLLSNWFMSYYAYVMIFSTGDNYRVTKISQAIIFLFPLIMFLPTFTDGFGQYQEYWCSYLRTGQGIYWFSAYIAIECCLVFGSLFCVCFIILKLRNVGDGNYEAILRVGRSTGLYAVATICCWLPKVFTLNDQDFHGGSPNASIFTARLFSYIVGLIYSAIFMFERKSLVSFEQYVKEYVMETNMTFNESFSSETSSSLPFDGSRPSLVSTSPGQIRMSLISDAPKSRMISTESVTKPGRTISGVAPSISSVQLTHQISAVSSSAASTVSSSTS